MMNRKLSLYDFDDLNVILLFKWFEKIKFLEADIICTHSYVSCALRLYAILTRCHRRTRKFSKGGQTIQIARIAPQIARIDRFLAHVNFSHACKLLESLSNIPIRVLNGGSGGLAPQNLEKFWKLPLNSGKFGCFSGRVPEWNLKLPEKWGGNCPPCPPVPYAYACIKLCINLD